MEYLTNMKARELGVSYEEARAHLVAETMNQTVWNAARYCCGRYVLSLQTRRVHYRHIRQCRWRPDTALEEAPRLYPLIPRQNRDQANVLR